MTQRACGAVLADGAPTLSPRAWTQHPRAATPSAECSPTVQTVAATQFRAGTRPRVRVKARVFRPPLAPSAQAVTPPSTPTRAAAAADAASDLASGASPIGDATEQRSPPILPLDSAVAEAALARLTASHVPVPSTGADLLTRRGAVLLDVMQVRTPACLPTDLSEMAHIDRSTHRAAARQMQLDKSAHGRCIILSVSSAFG